MTNRDSNGVSEIFDPSAWRAVPGFEFTDITYHRAVDTGAVRVAFNRPEIRNAFRPHTVDELFTRPRPRAHDHRRRLRAAHRQRPVVEGRRLGVLLGWRPTHPRQGRLPLRHRRHGGDHRSRARRSASHPRGAAPDPLHAEGRDLRRAGLGGGRRPQPARRLRPDARQPRARQVQADRFRRGQLRRRVRIGLPRPSGGSEVRPRDLLPRPRVHRRRRPPDGDGERGRAARRAGGDGARMGARDQRQEPDRAAHAQVRVQPDRRRTRRPAAVRRRGDASRLHDRRGGRRARDAFLEKRPPDWSPFPYYY